MAGGAVGGRKECNLVDEDWRTITRGAARLHGDPEGNFWSDAE